MIWGSSQALPSNFKRVTNITCNSDCLVLSNDNEIIVHNMTLGRNTLSISFDSTINTACCCLFETFKSATCILYSNFDLKIVMSSGEFYDYHSDQQIRRIFPTIRGLGILKTTSEHKMSLFVLESPLSLPVIVSSNDNIFDIIAVDESLLLTVDNNSEINIHAISYIQENKQAHKNLQKSFNSSSSTIKSQSESTLRKNKSGKIMKRLQLYESPITSKKKLSTELMLQELLGHKRESFLSTSSAVSQTSENYTAKSLEEQNENMMKLIKLSKENLGLSHANLISLFSGCIDDIGGLTIHLLVPNISYIRYVIRKTENEYHVIKLPSIEELLNRWGIKINERVLITNISIFNLSLNQDVSKCAITTLYVQLEASKKSMILYLIGLESLLCRSIFFNNVEDISLYFNTSIEHSLSIPTINSNSPYLLLESSQILHKVKLNLFSTFGYDYNEIANIISLLLSSISYCNLSNYSNIKENIYVFILFLSKSFKPNELLFNLIKFVRDGFDNSFNFSSDLIHYQLFYNFILPIANDFLKAVYRVYLMFQWNTFLSNKNNTIIFNQQNLFDQEFNKVMNKHYEIEILHNIRLGLKMSNYNLRECDDWLNLLDLYIMDTKIDNNSENKIDKLIYCKQFLIESIKLYKSAILSNNLNDQPDYPINKFHEIVVNAFQMIVISTKKDISYILNVLPYSVRNIIEVSLVYIRQYPNITLLPHILDYIGREDLFVNRYMSQSSVVNRKEDSDDGLILIESLGNQRFPHDERIHEVCRILRSSKPHYLRVTRSVEHSDLDFRHKQQIKLLSLCRRALSSSAGRGMLTFSTTIPVPEILQVPVLSLSGRIPPMGSIITLDNTSAPPELTLWPDYHNGVAAGLRLSFNEQKSTITRNWILYNKASAYSAHKEAEHAGILLALGLKGQLKSLSPNDICEYLTQGNEAITISILIGCSASKISSNDSMLSKTLCLHIPALLPQKQIDIEISSNVQAAALVSIGLLHYNSNHRLMTEFLLTQLSTYPQTNNADSRESLALCAGWSLGLVVLKGEKLDGLVDLCLEDRLDGFINGGERPNGILSNQLSTFGAPISKTSRVLESKSHINTSISCPGAIIALSLIYLQTNDATIASRISIPTTSYELEAIRSDLLFFRSLGYCLIMWDETKPTVQFIESLIPNVISYSINCYFNDNNIYKLKIPSYDKSNSIISPGIALLSYLCIISGICMGIGLVYAGTYNIEAKNILIEYLSMLQRLRDAKFPINLSSNIILNSNQNKQYKLDSNLLKPIIEMCICEVSLSLASIMSGTGDIDCLRIFRELRWKVEEFSYGTHFAINMSIGLLFLGNGKFSLKRDKLSISCLLISFCPRFPIRTIDNQYHLQSLRHLYTIATEQRFLQTIDIDNDNIVSVQVIIEMNDGKSYKSISPCLLPELSTVKSIRLSTNEMNYYHQEIILSDYLSTTKQKLQQQSIDSKRFENQKELIIALKSKAITKKSEDVNIALHGYVSINNNDNESFDDMFDLITNSFIY